MNILITGASGFIGSHITQALIQSGHQVVLCVREPQCAQKRWPMAQCIQADFSRDHDVADWLPRLKGIDVVINAVGIIRESGAQTFHALHTLAPCALFKACAKAKVKKVIQISALGADETAVSQYHLSKRAADECLMQQDVDGIILMPSIVYGPSAKSMAFFKALASLPSIPLVGKGDQPVQPIHIGDVLKVLEHVIAKKDHQPSRIILVGPRAISMKAMYVSLRHWLGLGKPRFISLPYYLALLLGRVSGFLTQTPLTKESIQMLQKGNTADVSPLVKQFGFMPRSFEQALLDTPAQQADKWHAGLYFLKPLLKLSIAFVWIFTGIVSAFIYPLEQSYLLLAKAGITGLWAPVMLYGAAVTDFAIGIATLVSYKLKTIGLLQIAIIVLYTVIISFSQAEQWFHPFGPVTKNIPLVVAILIMLRLERR